MAILDARKILRQPPPSNWRPSTSQIRRQSSGGCLIADSLLGLSAGSAIDERAAKPPRSAAPTACDGATDASQRAPARVRPQTTRPQNRALPERRPPHLPPQLPPPNWP